MKALLKSYIYIESIERQTYLLECCDTVVKHAYNHTH